MNSQVLLVAAAAADAGALSAAAKRLFVQAYGKYAQAGDLATHVEQYFGEQSVARELDDPDVSYAIALDAGVIAGFLKMRRGPAPDPVPAPHAIEVQQLYVDADRQRRGVGRMLMDRAVATAREEGHAGIWLSVWRDADWATAFYEAYGFRAVGTADFWLGRSRFTDYLMWLSLDGLAEADSR